MKKLLFLVVFGLFLPFFSFAEVPANTFFLMDGKGYGITGGQTHFCFMNGDCYTMDGKFSFKRGIQDSVQSKYTLLSIPNQWFPRTLDDSLLPDDVNVVCTNIPNGQIITLQCLNNSKYDIQIKQVLYSPITVKFDGDYASVNSAVNLSDMSNNLYSFTANSSNTSFVGSNAKIIFTLPTALPIPKYSPFTQTLPVQFLKSFNLYPSLVLVNMNGKDVVFGVK